MLDAAAAAAAVQVPICYLSRNSTCHRDLGELYQGTFLAYSFCWIARQALATDWIAVTLWHIVWHTRYISRHSVTLQTSANVNVSHMCYVLHAATT